MPPTPVSDPFVPCNGLTATVGGVNVAIMTGGFTLDFEEDDMTNNTGYGFHEDVATTKVANFDLTIASKGGLTGLKSGLIYPVLVNTATMPTITAGVMGDPTPTVAGAPCFAGNVRLKVSGDGILDVKMGVKYKVSGKSQAQFAYAV